MHYLNFLVPSVASTDCFFNKSQNPRRNKNGDDDQMMSNKEEITVYMLRVRTRNWFTCLF